MKNYRNLLLILILFTWIGCGKSDTDSSENQEREKPQSRQTIELDTSSISTDYQKNTKYLVVTSNTYWAISGVTEWCIPSPLNGKAGTTRVTIHIDENASSEDRNTTLVFNGSRTTASVTISQKQKDALIIAPTDYPIPVQGGTINVEVQANIDFTVEIPERYQSWIHSVDSRSMTVSNFIFTIDANEEGKERTGEIIFFDNNSPANQETITIKQAGITAIEIPDPYFKAYLISHFDEDHNGEISSKEAEQIWSIDCSNKGITSLKGIEHFPNLLSLNCDGNPLTDIDISQCKTLISLLCRNTQITNLDIQNHPTLSFLYCDDSPITNLGNSLPATLTYLSCNNTQITHLDVSQCVDLEYLYCSGTQISELDISRCLALKYLRCGDTRISHLNLANNSVLERLWCENTLIRNLDVTPCILLEILDCENLQLTNLDVSRCAPLTTLQCANNYLSTIDLTSNKYLRDIDCDPMASLKTIYLNKGQSYMSDIPTTTQVIYK